ncbi:MAG: pyruvate ferredoxin oxidoreductase [Caldilineaceae bacterium]|nr:pyruvate ferredoxin oxidoreductase [Caldilineaceae bacterium]
MTNTKHNQATLVSANGHGETFPYPGIPTTADGSDTVVWVDTSITHGACAYPITSSTSMGGGFGAAVANGKKNLWGDTLTFLEPESEHSSATACEGFALTGGRVSNFTSGQGLILMHEVLYTISGKRLPVVFHIGARALTSHSLNVHAGHDDVMSVRESGWGILFGRTAQESGDLALISRRAAEDSSTPFMNVQDGFLTTHTVEDVLLCEPEMMAKFVGKPEEKLVNMFDPYNPVMTGVVQNQDSYMKGKIAQRNYYDKVPAAIQNAMDEFYTLTGRRYNMVDTYGMEDADYAIVGMGCMLETAKATVDWIHKNEGIKVGVVHVTCFRPFPGAQIVELLKNLKAFTVIERMDDPLAQNNPLTADIKAAFTDAYIGAEGYPSIDRIPTIHSGSAGLGSRDVRPGHFVSIARNMKEGGRRFFVVGIDHELALPMPTDPDVRPRGGFSMRGHSVGGYGSVTTNKVIATIAGDVFGKKVQAYPKYGSEKKGLPTTYYLTVADEQILTHCELNQVEFVPLNDMNAFVTSAPLKGLQEGGTVFVQTPKTTPEEVWANIPPKAKQVIREKKLRIVAADGAKIAREEAPVADLEVRMQGIVLLGIFLKVTPFAADAGIEDSEVLERSEKALRKYFGKRGEKVVQANLRCVQRGYDEAFEVPAEVIAQDLNSPIYNPGVKIELFA